MCILNKYKKKICGCEEKYERQIAYNTNSLGFELSPNIPFLPQNLPIDKLKAEPKKLEEMSTYIKNLDYFQWGMYKMSKSI